MNKKEKLQEATIRALQNKLEESKTFGNVVGDYITIDGAYTESQYESDVYCYILFRSLDKETLTNIKEVVEYETYKDVEELVKIINKKFGPVDVIFNNNYSKHNSINAKFNI